MTGSIGHSHPGRHGVDVDTDLTRRGSDEIAANHLLTRLAVMTHRRMSGMPSVLHQDTDLDRLARRIARMRRAGQEALGITLEVGTDHEELLRRLGEVMYEDTEGARHHVERLVSQYLTYHDAAKHEWCQIAKQKFDEHDISRAIATHHNIVAVANALGLSMAETLVLLRSLVATDADIRDKRLNPKPKES